MADLVQSKAVVTALDEVALNGTEASRTSSAIDVRENEYVRIAYDLVGLDGTGLAAADVIGFTFMASMDEGATYRLIDFTNTDQTQEDLNPNRALVAGDISATLISRDIGSIDVSGLDFIKVIAGAVSGTPDGDNKISVYVKCWSE